MSVALVDTGPSVTILLVPWGRVCPSSTNGVGAELTVGKGSSHDLGGEPCVGSVLFWLSLMNV